MNSYFYSLLHVRSWRESEEFYTIIIIIIITIIIVIIKGLFSLVLLLNQR
jgi:hypothetical protein